MTGVAARTITEPQRQTPVLMSTDIVVVGGGTTGPLAAISAGRQGKKVVLIERFGSLGGNLTLGLNTKPSGPLLGGLPLELWNLARSVGAAGKDYTAAVRQVKSASSTSLGTMQIASPCDPEMMKILLARLCVEAGVQILFETTVSGPVMENGAVTGVIIESKAGRQAIAAKVVIDCSADADVAARAGVPFMMGADDGHNTMQPVTLFFIMNRVDIPRLAEWALTRDDFGSKALPDDPKDLDYGMWLTGFTALVHKFEAETGTKLERERITLKTANGVMYVNATRVKGVDIFDPIQFTDAVLECYRQIEALARMLRDGVPGFEQATLGQISPVLGVRETRHIAGEYTLTGPDVIEGSHFDDSIGADSSALDIHDPKGANTDFRSLPPYEIPYRCLVPKGVEQLLVAGRCISADHVAHGRVRNIPGCMTTGQAAGIAAAVAIDDGVPVRAVSVAKIQVILRRLGMPLRAQDIA
jgi:glycine/D-amino acid oxidase-like deaminating enzyme